MFINDAHEEYMYEKLIEILAEMNDDIVPVWNEYCDNSGYYDDRIEYMDSLDDLLCGRTATEILNEVDRDFNVRDDYFRFTIYGMESFSDPYDVVDVDDLADYIIKNEETLYSDELEDFWAEVEEQNEQYEELVEDKTSVLTAVYGEDFVNSVLNGRKVKNVKAKVAN